MLRLRPAIGLPAIAWLTLACLSLTAVSAQELQAQNVRPAPAPPSQAVGEREITVLNRSARAINELYVAPSAADQWGEDRLGDGTLAPGKSMRVRLGRVRECAFDVEVVYDNATREENRGVNVCRNRQLAFDGSAAVPVSPPAGDTHTVTLTNHAGRPIQQVFISPADANQWGDDRLGDDTISVGDAKSITYVGGCEADLRVVFDNRSGEERRGVNICDLPALSIEPGWTTADSPPTRPQPAPSPPPSPPPSAASSPPPDPPAAAATAVTVANRSGHDAVELYVFPDGAARGPDRLGAGELRDGATATIRIDRGDACKFTARVVYGGHVPDAELPGLDLCATPDIVLIP